MHGIDYDETVATTAIGNIFEHVSNFLFEKKKIENEAEFKLNTKSNGSLAMQ